MIQDQYNLSGRIAVVTGGAGLLGQQHVKALLEKDAIVYLADIDFIAAKSLCDQIEGDVRPLDLDVTNEESVKTCLDSIVKDEGCIDILVNNAAIDPKVDKKDIFETSRLENFPLDQWNFQIDVGLTGAFLCSKYFGRLMSTKKKGVILNIASDLSVFAPDQRIYQVDGLNEDMQPVKPITYSVIKTALLGLTRYLASYWADKGVRVNALSPGGVYTNQSDEFVKRLTSLIPLGRMAKKDEYKAALQFLCSDASSYMTGQNIIMDGGRSII